MAFPLTLMPVSLPSTTTKLLTARNYFSPKMAASILPNAIAVLGH